MSIHGALRCQASQAASQAIIHPLIEIAASSYEFEFGPRLINALCIIAKSFTTTTTMPEQLRETIQPASTMGMRCSDGTLVVKLLSGRCLLALGVGATRTTRIEMFSDNLNDLNYVNCLAADKECTRGGGSCSL